MCYKAKMMSLWRGEEAGPGGGGGGGGSYI